MWKAIFYWTGSALGLLALLAVVFVGGVTLYERWSEPFHGLWGLLFVSVGIVLVLYSVRAPESLLRSFHRKRGSRADEEAAGGPIPGRIFFAAGFPGVELVVGGIAYMILGEIWVVIAVLVVSSIIRALLEMILALVVQEH